MPGTLFICGLPIGNKADISARVLEKLKEVDLIAAEDTRVSALFLAQFNIKQNYISFHEHSKDKKVAELLALLQNGQNIALISDAGMPTISDPGYELVKGCHQNKIKVDCLPGPTALTTALALSGLPSDRFTFEGFLKNKTAQRKKQLEKLANESRTMIFYEAPHRILGTLADMKDNFGNRTAFVCRELTKKFEEHFSGTFSEIIEKLKTIKGEFVIVVEGAKINSELPDNKIQLLITTLKEKGLSNKDITEAINNSFALDKSKIKKLL